MLYTADARFLKITGSPIWVHCLFEVALALAVVIGRLSCQFEKNDKVWFCQYTSCLMLFYSLSCVASFLHFSYSYNKDVACLSIFRSTLKHTMFRPAAAAAMSFG